MKENIKFVIDGDISAVECDVFDAFIKIDGETDGGTCEKCAAEFPDAKNVNAGASDGTLLISQRKRNLFSSKQKITLSVPAHIVPSLKMSAKYSALEMSGGIYADFSLNAESGDIKISDCVFESLEIIGGGINVTLKNCTVKNGLYIKLEKGNVLAENSFSTRCEYRVRSGNIGLYDITCKECVAEAEKGNVTAVIHGFEEDYNYTVLVKDGTANRTDKQTDGANYNVEIYAGEGNAVLDFSETKKPEIPEETSKPSDEKDQTADKKGD